MFVDLPTTNKLTGIASSNTPAGAGTDNEDYNIAAHAETKLIKSTTAQSGEITGQGESSLSGRGEARTVAG